MSRFIELMQLLEDFIGTSTEPGTIKWKHDKDDKFSVNKLIKENQVCNLKTRQAFGNKCGKT